MTTEEALYKTSIKHFKAKNYRYIIHYRSKGYKESRQAVINGKDSLHWHCEALIKMHDVAENISIFDLKTQTEYWFSPEALKALTNSLDCSEGFSAIEGIKGGIQELQEQLEMIEAEMGK